MNIKCIYGIDYDSNIYVITGEIPTIIDSGTGLHNDRIIKEISKKINLEEIKQIVLTHEHFDHTGGLKKLKEKLDGKVQIIAHENAASKIEKGNSEFAIMLGVKFENVQVDKKLYDFDELQIGDKNWKVIHTPGHTTGCICLYEKDTKSLISGDTIFSNGSFGRYDFPGGDLNELIESIEKISKLDVENMYPGHEGIVIKNANMHINKSLENCKLLR